MGDSKTELKLLELFDVLSKSFYSLQLNYDKLKNDLESISKNQGGETKQIVIQIEKDLQITKSASERIEKIMFELQAYKDNLHPLPGQIFDHLHDITNKLIFLTESLKKHDSTSSDAIKKLNETFNEEFITAVKDIKNISKLTDELQPIAKLSKLVSKPLGLIIVFITLVASVALTLTTFIKTKDQIKDVVIKAVEQVAVSAQQKNVQKK